MARKMARRKGTIIGAASRMPATSTTKAPLVRRKREPRPQAV